MKLCSSAGSSDTLLNNTGIRTLVAVIVQVIKELPWLKRIPTSVVALTVSLLLCPLAVVIVWYYVFASFIAAFIVYLVATGGWERVVEMRQRTKYKNK